VLTYSNRRHVKVLMSIILYFRIILCVSYLLEERVNNDLPDDGLNGQNMLSENSISLSDLYRIVLTEHIVNSFGVNV
jgi:hypothetical protein